ncbi:predicted protein [Sclerotinia sclerotiorum 1980 UF-70]|uniref:Uncharacterized protein n=1 Tax=Sclerotinia sclerotiorum (strain ATCC 18683 / 1980 / Ss-1) TaxID=665079 RepID=A7F780_SCLS1|nr:predicted protein [Sclerotinia sclerotiorum 1980 UF-70]EDN98601.1 predicted protein [Sclerotinia sclerotiorum 1980 UF-70]
MSVAYLTLAITGFLTSHPTPFDLPLNFNHSQSSNNLSCTSTFSYYRVYPEAFHHKIQKLRSRGSGLYCSSLAPAITQWLLLYPDKYMKFESTVEE